MGFTFPNRACWPKERKVNACQQLLPALSLAAEDVHGVEGKGVGSCRCVFSTGIGVAGFAVARGTHK